MQTIYPCLWFKQEAEEAAAFYAGIFPATSVLSSNPMAAVIESSGQRFLLLNGNPEGFTPTISFYVHCTTAEVVDKLWEALIVGGHSKMPLGAYDWSSRYGWLQDKFGVNWQLVLGDKYAIDQTFTPSLLFTGEVAGKTTEAIGFYTTVFPVSALSFAATYPAGQKDEGLVMHAQFRLQGKLFMAMDSSLMHQMAFNDSISFVVECETQEEIDRYWAQLTAGGAEKQCGWLMDRYGIRWQIVPTVLAQLMRDPARAPRVMQAFLKMKKFNIQALLDA